MEPIFPTDGVELTVLRLVNDVDRSRTWYRDVLGATDYREYGGTSAVMRFQGVWLLLVTGGGPRATSRRSASRRPPTLTPSRTS